MPVLTLDTGETLTENVAILDWIAQQNTTLRPAGPTGQTQLLQALAYIPAEIHESFKPFLAGASDADKQKAGEDDPEAMRYLADRLQGDDLFVMLLWAKKNGVEVPEKRVAVDDRMMEWPAVQHEGLVRCVALLVRVRDAATKECRHPESSVLRETLTRRLRARQCRLSDPRRLPIRKIF